MRNLLKRRRDAKSKQGGERCKRRTPWEQGMCYVHGELSQGAGAEALPAVQMNIGEKQVNVVRVGPDCPDDADGGIDAPA